MKPFQHYIDMGMIRHGSPDKNAARNIVARAMKRLGYIRSQEINQDTAPFIFEDAYEGILTSEWSRTGTLKGLMKDQSLSVVFSLGLFAFSDRPSN